MKAVFVTEELVRYMIVGLCALAVDATLFAFLAHTCHCNCYLAITVSFCVGVIANFVLTSLFVFDKQPEKTVAATFIRYVGASVAALVFNYIGLYIWMSFYPELHPFIARIALATIFFGGNFVIVRRFVFGAQSVENLSSDA